MRHHADHFSFFFFNDTATTEIYTLSLHDALPIYACRRAPRRGSLRCWWSSSPAAMATPGTTCSSPSSPTPSASRSCTRPRSEEHTSELQSQSNLVCRLLLEKTNTTQIMLQRGSMH